MRIAIDARAAAEVPAGRGRYVREMLAGLSRLDADHEFTLYARSRWTDAPLDARFRWQTPQAPGLSWPLVAGQMMSARCDLALACTSYAMAAPWRIPGAAIIWDLAPFDRKLRTPTGSLLERVTLPIAIRRCARLIAISRATRDDLRERFPRSAVKTEVAYPAADPRFSPTPVAGDYDVLVRHGVQRPYALVTGTLEPRKNLPRLIEAFAGLPEQTRRGWTLVLVGASGWKTDSTFASAAKHADLVRTLGFVCDDDLAALYRQAGMFCYVSLYEGFGIPVLEAMQSGTPVLTSSVSSMPEVGGEAARYADPTSISSIRCGMEELISDADLRARCSAAGISQATRFNWEQTAQRILGVLEALAEGGR